MNRNKKTKNIKMNKSINYIELTANVDTPESIDNMLKKESESFR